MAEIDVAPDPQVALVERRRREEGLTVTSQDLAAARERLWRKRRALPTALSSSECFVRAAGDPIAEYREPAFEWELRRDVWFMWDFVPPTANTDMRDKDPTATFEADQRRLEESLNRLQHKPEQPAPMASAEHRSSPGNHHQLAQLMEPQQSEDVMAWSALESLRYEQQKAAEKTSLPETDDLWQLGRNFITEQSMPGKDQNLPSPTSMPFFGSSKRIHSFDLISELEHEPQPEPSVVSELDFECLISKHQPSFGLTSPEDPISSPEPGTAGAAWHYQDRNHSYQPSPLLLEMQQQQRQPLHMVQDPASGTMYRKKLRSERLKPASGAHHGNQQTHLCLVQEESVTGTATHHKKHWKEGFNSASGAPDYRRYCEACSIEWPGLNKKRRTPLMSIQRPGNHPNKQQRPYVHNVHNVPLRHSLRLRHANQQYSGHHHSSAAELGTADKFARLFVRLKGKMSITNGRIKDQA